MALGEGGSGAEYGHGRMIAEERSAIQPPARFRFSFGWKLVLIGLVAVVLNFLFAWLKRG